MKPIKVGHLRSELGLDPHLMLIRHHDSETLLINFTISKIRLQVLTLIPTVDDQPY